MESGIFKWLFELNQKWLSVPALIRHRITPLEWGLYGICKHVVCPTPVLSDFGVSTSNWSLFLWHWRSPSRWVIFQGFSTGFTPCSGRIRSFGGASCRGPPCFHLVLSRFHSVSRTERGLLWQAPINSPNTCSATQVCYCLYILAFVIASFRPNQLWQEELPSWIIYANDRNSPQ